MYTIQIAGFSETGNRERNEDYYLYAIKENTCIVALADGLGGHGKGDAASQLVCHTAMKLLEQEDLEKWNVQFIYEMCQEELLKEQIRKDAQGQMRTTLSLLTVGPHKIRWNHIGDSRTYYFRNRQLVQRTFDHSVPQMLCAMGEIREQEIRFHPERNRLLKVLGVEGYAHGYEEETDLEVHEDMQFLLCSDGFWELINEEQMALCLAGADDAELWLENMLELVHRNGRGEDTDNTTAVCVWIKEKEE